LLLLFDTEADDPFEDEAPFPLLLTVLPDDSPVGVAELVEVGDTAFLLAATSDVLAVVAFPVATTVFPVPLGVVDEVLPVYAAAA